MTSSAASKAERIVGSFASLLSSALALDGGKTVEPLKDSSDVLPRFISPSVASDDICLVIPSLLLKHATLSTSNGSSLEEAAALNLAHPVALSTKEIEAAPMALLANLCDSFTSLIDSRLRSSIQALVRQAHSQKDATLTRVLVGLLACSQSPITPSTVVTSFRTLPACEITPEGEIVMPVVMECVVDLKIFGNLATVTIVAPGTIQTAISSDFMISRVEIVLDTLAFLQSMMKQARFAVRKAVATASNIATNLLMPSSLPETRSEARSMPSKVPSSEDLKHQLATQESLPVHSSIMPPPPSSLMPPPPSRPSKRSLADLAKPKPPEPTGGEQNASWGTPSTSSNARDRAIASGLSLLTAAAGLNGGDHQTSNWPDPKRQRTDNVTLPRKVTSCPRLEAAV